MRRAASGGLTPALDAPLLSPAWRGVEKFGPELLLLLGGLVFAILGRGRWADVLSDQGVWFSDAQSMLAGGHLLHEVRIQYGPVSVWVLAGFLKVFGVRVSTLVIAQFLIGLAATLGVQVFSRRFLSFAERWLCAALLIVVNLWMSGPGNLLYPYAFAVSHALLAATIAVELVARSSNRRQPNVTVAVAGAIGGIAFATKQEIGAAALVGMTCLVIFSRDVSPRRKLRAIGFIAFASAAAYALIFWIALHGSRFIDIARKNLLWPWAPVPDSWNQLYRRSQGLDHPGLLLVSAGDTLLIAAVFGGTVWLLVYATSISRRRVTVFVSVLLAGWALWAWRWTEGSHFVPMMLCLPLLVASAILALVRARRGDRDRLMLGPTFAIIAGALLLLSREGYRGGLEGFYSGMGYVLAIPAAVPVLAAGARGPAAVGRRRWIVAALSLALLGRAGAHRLAVLRSHWDSLVPFVTERGVVYSGRSATGFLEQEAKLIESRTRPGDPILMIPVTGGLDFLLDRQNMSFFPNMVPGVIVGEDGERELIERWKAHPPRLVIEVEGVLGVFRRGDFGKTWGRSAQEWIEQNYQSLPPLDPHGRVRVWALAPPNRS